MNNTLDILIRIRTEAQAALDQARKDVQSFTSVIKKNSKSIKEASLIAAGLVGGLGIIGASFANNASQVEQYRIAFDTMLGSTKAGGRLLSEVSQFARKTPFDLPQVVEGTQRLLAYNIAQKDIIPTFSMLGNIAAGVGKDKLPQLILAFGQVKAATRLTGMELRQFTEAGVPMLDILAKQFGKTAGEVQDMVSNGQVSFNDVQTALQTLTGEGGKFFNLMERQSKTFGGVMSNVRDEMFRTSLAIMGMSENGEIRKGSIFYYLKIGAEQLLLILQQAQPALTTFFDGIMKNKDIILIFVGALTGLVLLAVGAFIFFHATALLVIGIVMALGAVIALLIGHWDDMVNYVNTKVKAAFDWLMGGLERLWLKVVDVKNKIVGAFRGMADGIMNALQSIKFPHLSIGEGSVKIAGKDIKFPKLDVAWYEQGGWVRNTGLAMVHQGEYVMSKDMLAGRQPAAVSPASSYNQPVTIYATINNPVDMNYLAYKIGYELRNR